MKITKQQLRRIIKEETRHIIKEVTPANAQFSPGDSTLEITQDKYNQFAAEIADGPYGWIDADDVARQWEGTFGVDSLSNVALDYLIANLDANGLIADPEEMGEY